MTMTTRLLLLCIAFPTGLAAQESCRSDLKPSGYPLSSQVDSAGFMNAINHSWLDGEQLAVLVPGYDSLGAPSRAPVHSYSHRGLHPQSHAIEAAFLRFQRPESEENEKARALVLSKGAGVEAYFLDSVETCIPKVKNMRALNQRVARAFGPSGSAELRNMTRSGRLRASFLVHVDTDGSLTEIRVDRSSGNFAVDRVMSEAISDVAEVEPGYLEGIPVYLWVRIPISIQFRTRR